MSLEKMAESLRETVDLFSQCRVLVIGDVGLDEYVFGEVDRISPEAPVPVVDVKRQDLRLGLAGNVARNLISLGGRATLLGVVGDDEEGRQFCDLMKKERMEPQFILKTADRPTTRKMRVMADDHHIVRVDYEQRGLLSDKLQQRVLEAFESLVSSFDGVIVQDYGKGLFSEKILQTIISVCRRLEKRVLVDPHRTTPISFYRGAHLFKPNREEAISFAKTLGWRGVEGGGSGELGETLYKQVANHLKGVLESPHLVITRGKEGMSLFSEEEGDLLLPTYAREVFDVTGAGDTVLATLALGWLKGRSLEEACVLANLAAGVVVAQVGSVSCHRQQLIRYMESHLFSKNVK